MLDFYAAFFYSCLFTTPLYMHCICLMVVIIDQYLVIHCAWNKYRHPCTHTCVYIYTQICIHVSLQVVVKHEGHTVNREIFISAKFRICNLRVQIFLDTSQPSENLRTENFLVLDFLLTRAITGRLSRLNILQRSYEGHRAFMVAIAYGILAVGEGALQCGGSTWF